MKSGLATISPQPSESRVVSARPISPQPGTSRAALTDFRSHQMESEVIVIDEESGKYFFQIFKSSLI